MQFLHRAVALVFLVLWVPMTTHCLWEGDFGGDFFKCAPNTAEKGDCSNDGDACGTLETGTYKIGDTAVVIPAPVFAILLFEISPPVFEESNRVLPETAAPEEIPQSWLFSSRAALPPRAPSRS